MFTLRTSCGIIGHNKKDKKRTWLMANSTFSFIHAADLHLGAAFKGLDGEDLPLRQIMGKSTFKALNNLVELCLKLKPQALLLAGDLYNPEAGALKSLGALKDAFNTLRQHNIAVFIAHGNHDPASAQQGWTWPDNVFVFSAQKVNAVPFYPISTAHGNHAPQQEKGTPNPEFTPNPNHNPFQATTPLAVIHGQSHASFELIDNLALDFTPSARAAKERWPVWQIGLLHCAVSGPKDSSETGAHKPYAPCSQSDLSNAQLDYWALGHIHKRMQPFKAVPAFYSGNTQGLHINEEGSKGCLHITLSKNAEPLVTFYPLAPVEWRQLTFDLATSNINNLSSLEDALLLQLKQLPSTTEAPIRLWGEQIAAARPSAPSSATLLNVGRPLEGHIVRLILSGRTPLHKLLREQENDLLLRLREKMTQEQNQNPGQPFVWLKDIELRTKPWQDLSLAAQREDLLGETLRRLQSAAIAPDSKALLATVQPLHSKVKEAELEPLEDEDWQNLLNQAALLCFELLSPQDEEAQDGQGAFGGNSDND